MFFDNKHISIEDAKVINPQVLAFVGDAVHTLYVRGEVAYFFQGKPNDLHKTATTYIKAKGQSEMVDIMLPLLTPEEQDIFRRARNYKTNNIAKNASVGDYKRATAFEAVIGYLYLTNQHERMISLLHAVSSIGEHHES